LRTVQLLASAPTTNLTVGLHSVTDRVTETERRQHDANSRSYYVAVWSAKNWRICACGIKRRKTSHLNWTTIH